MEGTRSLQLVSSMEELSQTGKDYGPGSPCVLLMRADQAQTRRSKLALLCPARIVADVPVSQPWHPSTGSSWAWHMGQKGFPKDAALTLTPETAAMRYQVLGECASTHSLISISKVIAGRQMSSTWLCCRLCKCACVTHLCTRGIPVCL